MNKFNWNRFYDELETADPKKFPFWMWFTHEMTGFVGSLVTGAITGFLLFFFIVIMVGATLKIAHTNPALTQKTIEAFCSGYSINPS
jgi:hypothetical protein